jgi:hypothetical protein
LAKSVAEIVFLKLIKERGRRRRKAVLAGLFCGVWREFEGEKGERAKN